MAKNNLIAGVVLCLLAALGLVYNGRADEFGLGLSGKKNVGINDKVGKSELKFHSRAPMEDIDGTADGVSGSFTLDFDNLEKTTGKIVVQVKSMQTGIRKRDEHLYSAEWLDAEQHPEMHFTVKKLSNIKADTEKSTKSKAVVKATAHGDFYLHGVSVEMAIPVSISYIPASAETRKRAPGDFVLIQADFSIPLAKFNIQGKKGIVGSKVGEVIAVEAALFGATKS